MLQDLVSLQLFYFKHPHDTKEFAIFFLLAKIHNHQQFQFSYLIFFFNSSVPGLYRGKERGRAGKAAAARGIVWDVINAIKHVKGCWGEEGMNSSSVSMGVA